MEDAELQRKLDQLKEKIEITRSERDELKQRLHDVTDCWSSDVASEIPAETIRERTIEIWKEIERRERRYRVQAVGLETQRKVFDDQLFFLETR